MTQKNTRMQQLYKQPPIWKSYLPGVGIFEREVRRFFTVPAQTLAAPMGSSLLYFTIFYFSIGRLIETSSGGAQNLSLGINYVEFLIPGIMCLELINASFQNPVSSLIIAKWSGNIVDQLMAPIDAFSLWMAYISGALVRASIVAMAAYLSGSLFAWNFPMHHPLLLVYAILVAVTSFGSIGVIAGTLCRNFDQVGMIGSFIMQPLIFLSGVFFSLSQLPESLSFLPYLNPVYYVLNLFRHAVVGVGDIPISTALLCSTVFSVLLSLLAIRLLAVGKGLKS